jgi:hypothetical protein
MYKSDRGLICICHLHGFQSQIPDPDSKVIFAAFKKAHCDSCEDLDPSSSLFKFMTSVGDNDTQEREFT